MDINQYQAIRIASIFHHFSELFKIDFTCAVTRLLHHFLNLFLWKTHVQLVADPLELLLINVPSFADINEFKCHLHFFLEIRVHKFPILSQIYTFWTGTKIRHTRYYRFRLDRLPPTDRVFLHWMGFIPSTCK